MIENTGTLVFGVGAGLVVSAVLLIIAVVLARLAIKFKNDKRSHGLSDFWGFALAGAIIAAVIGVLVLYGALFPFQKDYLTYTRVEGNVESINSRLLNGAEERFVIGVNGQLFGVDDTRAATLEVGDPIGLLCVKEWQWGSDAHGWGCNWASLTGAVSL